MLAELLAIIAPVFLCAAVGWSWVRAGGRWDRKLLSDLVFWVASPCLVFSSLTSLDAEPAALLRLAGASALGLAGCLVAGGLVLRAARLPQRAFLPTLVFANTGNMGMPLCLFAFGENGLALGVAWFAVNALGRFTLGVWIESGSLSLRELVRTPMTHAAVWAVVVMAADVPVPRWLANTLELLGSLAIPLMLLTLGVSLGELRPARISRTLALGALRLALGLGIGLLLCALLELRGVARGVVLLQSTMPSAVFNYLFAEQYGRAPDEVASVVILSTALSAVAIPLVLAWVI